MTKKIDNKSWDPKLEYNVIQEWNDNHIYDFIPSEDNFVIDTPPPYPSGKPWHIGAAAHYAQIDMIARTARMCGKNVYFPIGIDRNGLPVEIYTEKKHHIKLQNVSRNEFLNLCRESLDDLEKEILQIMKHLGISGEFTNYYRTDSDEYRTLTQATFIELWNKGHIYIANRPNNYDCQTKTTISDAEITYMEKKTKLTHIKFKLLKSHKTIIVSSTRPELLCSCKMIIVHPDDERYSKIIGQKVIVPIYNNIVEIRTHKSVKMEFGTGIVMICSYGDQNDVALFRELNLDESIAIGLDGKMTNIAGKYAGLKIEQARSKIISELKNLDAIEKIEKIDHNIPISERSKTPIEIIPMQEYYLKQKNVTKIKELCSKIEFHPKMHKQILIDWIDSISIDWPISRRRYYGTEIPIWYCKKCTYTYVPKPGKYYIPWKDKCPINRCPECTSTDFRGEDKILDTWMDSSISPLFITKFQKNEKFFAKTYPTTIRPQAKDIVRTWLYYTLLRCNQITRKTPWSKVWIMGHGLDHKGLKMSKSAKNAVDPFPIINEFGADAFRFWSASIVNHGYDFRCDIEKIKSAQKFLSKLWNISRFISNFDIIKCRIINKTDKWILSELNKLILNCKRGYQNYNFFIPTNMIREFTWNVFAPHYIEMVKNRAYGNGNMSDEEKNSAICTLHKVLSSILLLLAPITPFITDYLWKKIYSNNSIHIQKQVAVENYDDMTSFTNKIIKFNSRVWIAKKDNNISLNKQIELPIPEELDMFKKDLVYMHNLKE
ncbi:MAG: valine--tRNA ligase [Thaumarchaeota archaeon]|nr:valine--tRNA ligase [Nitrososphaerota archaeon]MCY3976332.1 valine--tRNA ligase [Nitrososphaerota archaeon]